jgi:hypothetical protein
MTCSRTSNARMSIPPCVFLCLHHLPGIAIVRFWCLTLVSSLHFSTRASEVSSVRASGTLQLSSDLATAGCIHRLHRLLSFRQSSPYMHPLWVTDSRSQPQHSNPYEPHTEETTNRIPNIHHASYHTAHTRPQHGHFSRTSATASCEPDSSQAIAIHRCTI